MNTYTIEIYDRYARRGSVYFLTVDPAELEAGTAKVILQYCRETGATWIPEAYDVTVREGTGHIFPLEAA